MIRIHTSNKLLILPLLSVVYLCLLSGTALAENQVMGTIEAELDGEKKTWYILQPADGMPPTGMLMPMGPDHLAASLTAYASKDQEFTFHEMVKASMPVDSAEVIMIVFDFPVGASKGEYSMPSETGMRATDVIWQSDTNDNESAFYMGRGSGELLAPVIKASMDGGSTFKGSFSGTLKKLNGDETITVSNGRFEVEGASFYSN